MTGKPRIGGLGRGLGALIPTAAPREAEPEQPAQPTQSAQPSPAVASESEASHGPTPRDHAEHTNPDVASDDTATEPAALAADPGPGADLVPVVGAEFAELPLDQIRANAKQP